MSLAGLSPSHSPKGADIHGDNVWECHTEPVLACCYSKTGETVVAASHDKSLSVWNAKGQLLKKLEGGHNSAIYWCALSPDLETVASASHDETLKLWNLAEGRWFANLRGHEAPVRSCDFSPDGKLLASASYDKTCKIWEIDGTRCIQTLKGHRGMVRSVNFAPNGTVIASCSNDKTVKLWRVENGECLSTLEGHTDVVSTVAFSPSGTLLASASYDFTVKLWDPDTGVVVREMKSDDQMLSCSFSRDESMLTTTSNAKVVDVWNTSNGECILALNGHTAPVFCAQFGPHGRMLVSGSHDCTLRMWDLEYEKVMAAKRNNGVEKARREAEEAMLRKRQAEEDELRKRQMEDAEVRRRLEEEERLRRDEAERLLREEEARRRAEADEARRSAGEMHLRRDMEQAEREWRSDPCVISAGAWFSLIIGKDGNTYSLGDNLMGQCGGDKTEHPTPMIVSGLPHSQVRMVSAGQQHSMFVLANGHVFGCGSNEYGQLGISHLSECHTPTQVHSFADLRIKRAAAGGYHTVFLAFDGSVWSAGCNDHGQLGQGEIGTAFPVPGKVDMTDRVKFIDAGPQCSAAITEAGGLFAWGDPVEGQTSNHGMELR